MISLSRKSQATIFIIIGIVLLFVVAFGFFFITNNSENISEVKTVIPKELSPIKNYFDECFNNKMSLVVRKVALQGGFYEKPSNTLPNYFIIENRVIDVPIYLSNNNADIISNDEMIQQILFGFEKEVTFCNNFNTYGFNVSVDFDSIDTNIRITNSSLISDIYLPVIIKKNNSASKIDRFNLKMDSDLMRLKDIASQITLEQNNYGNMLCLTCFSDIVEQNNIRLQTTERRQGNDSYVVFTINGSGDYFNFAHKFDKIIDKRFDSRFSIDPIDKLIAQVGYEFSHLVDTNGNVATFSDNSDMFDISENGLIKFTPAKSDIGKHVLSITAIDSFGNTAKEHFILVVEDLPSSFNIDYIGYKNVNVGEEFTYQVNVSSEENSSYVFDDDTDLFDISENGLVNFVPKSENIGLHMINITVINSEAYQDNELMRLDIR